MKSKTLNKMLVVFGLLFLFSQVGTAQMSYEEFHAKYLPHNEKLAPDYSAVKVVNESDAETGALVVELLIQQAEAGDEESELKIVAILTSCNRNVVAALLKEMDHEEAVNALNYIKYEWQREIMYFVDKTTYHNLAPHLLAITTWDGPAGPFGPELKNWSPAYAGIGLDMGWGGYKGINEYIDAYNAWPSKGNNPVYTLSEPVTNLSTSIGFGANAAFYIKKKGFLEINYINRTAKGNGGGVSPEVWTKELKFNTHSISIAYLQSKGDTYKMMRFYNGWGLHFQLGGVKERNSVSNPDWKKLGSGFTAGVNYNIGLFINPIKKLPVMFGIRGYAQFNILGYDVNYMETASPQLAWGGTGDEKLKSVMNVFGAQFQVMYKFGKTGDSKDYKDFDAELAENLDNHVNTTYTEILPIISPDGKTLYFIRSDHPYNNKGSLNSQDVWVADVTDGIDNAIATRMEKPLNTMTYNMIAGVSPDGNSMLIKGVFNAKGEYEKRGYSFINKTKNGWSKPKAIELPDYDNMVKGPYTGAYWTQDGKHIIMSFSEDKDVSNQDLYVSHLKDDGTWTRPTKLGSTINTDGDEHSPFLASDGKTLYYSTNKDGGLGSNDIWMSKMQDDSWTNWSEPINLGDEVNTDEWDAYYSIDAQGEYAYMASAKNSVGNEDIVRIKLKEEVQPDPVVLITGKVFNKKTNEPLGARIDYNGLIDGKNYGVARTNPVTGEYTIILPYGINYDFTASAEGFLGVSENLDLSPIGEYKEIKRDLYLVPIEVGATIRLNNIFFETGKADLKKESFSELDRVVEFLKDNPNVKIELSGHTDNVGDKAFNKNLSQKRADTVMQYIISKGINVARLTGKGYGMEKPVADNATEEGRALNRRVEFTILEN